MNRYGKTLRSASSTVLTIIALITFTTAQTPVAVLENADGDTVLTSFTDGGLLVTGVYGTGTIPTEGPGVRMMWHPAKAAFRTGQITGMRWDDSQVGELSFASGYDTQASGGASTAWGQATTASGTLSTVWGSYTTASGLNATAWGAQTNASGNYSTAWGYGTVVFRDYSTAWGLNTIAMGRSATAWGLGTSATEIHATAWGYHTSSDGRSSTAWGEETTASGNYSTAWGISNTASGGNSTAWGLFTTSRGEITTAFGLGVEATTPNSTSIGSYNASNLADDNTLFVIGNGPDNATRSDAFRVDIIGNVTASGTFTTISDRRLKENIQPLDSHTLDKLAKIQPVRYTFKDQKTKPSGTQIGLIAQEIQAQFPELVMEHPNGYLSVSYSHFTAVLLKGLQEQQAQIEAQKIILNKQHSQIQIQHKNLEKKDQQIKELHQEVQRLSQFEARLTILEQQMTMSVSQKAE